MISVRKEQFAALSEELRKADQSAMARRLLAEYPTRVGHMSDLELKNFVKEGCEEANNLMIFDSEHVYRYLVLPFKSTAALSSPFLTSIMIRILNNVGLDGGKRLDFIDQQVIPRARD